ncbi:MAG TPA: outer membrane beta-barrel protein [Acidobacteriaceae bacterium]
MLKTLKTIGLLACMLSIPSMGHTQALPTATGRGALQVGGGYSYAKADYGQKGIQGISAFADFDLGLHYGVEADFHYLSLVTPDDIGENSFLVGPRFILPHHRFKLYGKGLIGLGDLNIQLQQDNIGHPGGTNFAYAAGGGLDVVINRHIIVRPIDFEYQHWNYQTGLTPSVFTAGIAYRIR